MRAFVTGGTGLIGRHIVEALLARDWEVSVLTRDPSRAKDFAARGVEVIRGDVVRPKFQAAASRADVVFHAAAWFEVGVLDAQRMFETNVTGTGNVLSMARKEHVARVVYTSTAGIFTPASVERPATEDAQVSVTVDDPYVVSKVAAHKLAVGEMHAGLPLTIVAPAAVVGQYDTGQLGRSLALLVRGRLRLLPRGLGRNTWTHAADVADGHVLAATQGKPGAVYLLGDRVLRLAEFYGIAAKAVGIAPPRASVPMGFARLVARVSESRARLADRTPILSRASLDLASRDVVVDASKARRELGWNPRPFEDRMRETMAWYLEKYSSPAVPLPVKPDGASA